MDTPNHKRAILAIARTLRDTTEWSNTYISPDQTPQEREQGRKLRQELKDRREAGEEDITIRGHQIVHSRRRTISQDNQPQAMATCRADNKDTTSSTNTDMETNDGQAQASGTSHQVATSGHKWLQVVTSGFMWLKVVLCR